MGGKISSGEVAFGPAEECVEAWPIVGDQREEHRVGLRLRRRAVVRIVIDDSRLVVDEPGDVTLPYRGPPLLAAARIGAGEQENGHEQNVPHRAAADIIYFVL